MSKVRFCGILIVCIWILAGCSLSSQERVKLRDLDFTVLGEEKIPEQLKTIIEEKKNTAFEITRTMKTSISVSDTGNRRREDTVSRWMNCI